VHGSETVAPNLVSPTYRAARRRRPPPGVASRRGEHTCSFYVSLFVYFLGQLPLTSLSGSLLYCATSSIFTCVHTVRLGHFCVCELTPLPSVKKDTFHGSLKSMMKDKDGGIEEKEEVYQASKCVGVLARCELSSLLR